MSFFGASFLSGLDFPKKTNGIDLLDDEDNYKINSADLPANTDDGSSLFSQYKKITSNNTASSKLKGLLDAPPNPDDYSPSKTDRLAAILSGATTGFFGNPGDAYKVSKGIIDEPFNAATKQYQNKVTNLEKLSNIEQASNNSDLKGLEYEQADQNRKDRLAETSFNHDQLNAKADADRAEKLQAREDAGWKVITDADTGETFAINPINGKSESFGVHGLSAEAKIADAAKRAGAISKAELPDKITIADRNNTARASLADTNNAAKSSRLIQTIAARNAAAQAKIDSIGSNSPNKQLQQIKLNLATAVGQDPDLADFFETKNGLPVAVDPNHFESMTPEQVVKFNKIKSILGGLGSTVTTTNTKPPTKGGIDRMKLFGGDD